MKANEPGDAQNRPPQRPNLRMDESALETHYTNVTRVTAGPEEVIVDFGMSAPDPRDPKQQRGSFTDRLIMNYYNAKRLAVTLNATVARYEKAFGSIELDARKRQIPGTGEQ